MLSVCVLLFAAGAACASVPQNISAVQARDMIAGDSQIYLLDVRTFQEYSQVRLAGAHLIPIDQLLRRIAELPKDQPILVYCAVGSRSTQVVNYLAKIGYGPVYNLNGGIWAWQLRGYPVLKGAP
ncbi:MAG: rhodanese-like domain-containing protein [Desulfuromonas sp.]|nr:MAG: rhodanese-like domain-containing protein [Desulfuromonas sp.]